MIWAAIGQIWLVILCVLVSVFAARHWYFAFNRLSARQRRPQALLSNAELPGLTVLVPMHNEGSVVARALDCLLSADYPADRLEIIGINDHSSDDTGEILKAYEARDSRVRGLHIYEGARGKPAGLNRALKIASHEIVLIFDADYAPGPHLLRLLVSEFRDPSVGACMGRVVPRNAHVNFLTRMLAFERTGGYQVNQQARANLGLVPQYGGTVGGFRKSVIESYGGFDPNMLAEDTDLTIRLYTDGYRVAYVNEAECYEEVPETWNVRYRQLRRWARGHDRVLFRRLVPMLRSPHMTNWQKLDATLLLLSFLVGPLVLSGFAVNIMLFIAGQLAGPNVYVTIVFLVGAGIFGSVAPLYEIAAGELLDGARERVLLLPFVYCMIPFNTWALTMGACDAIADSITGRMPKWDKTQRFTDGSSSALLSR
jgi:cellulose synthase/poly-beta-1,6-N-acetylglucosamine synthase-like glycosyltransferase